jgi:hypothetical protein
MAKIRRNGPCPCGSGSKAKCCSSGIHHLPLEFCREVVRDLKGIDEVEWRSLVAELPYLPRTDTALQTRLGTLTPNMDRAIDALQNDDYDEFGLATKKVAPEVDSVARRIELVRTMITLRDQGRIPRRLAAFAVIELGFKESILFLSSVAESLKILAGERGTPPGLTVSTR